MEKTNVPFSLSFNGKLLLAALFCFAWTGVSAASLVTPVKLGTITSLAAESSGLDYTGGTHFWTHNDGYGDNNLYRIASDGSYTRTVTVTNVVNYDWEDLTHDASRTYMYIGDFGNNDHDRTNLRINRITYPSGISGSTVTADVIRFSYPDQTSFPSTWLNFDVEAFIHFNGFLYLFTKGDGQAMDYTKMYRLPDDPGTYVATLIDSFYVNDRITSADINEDGTALVLLANTNIHLFTGWTGSNFFNGQYTHLHFSTGWTQKEGIAFRTRTQVYISDENSGAGNHLYSLSLSAWIPPVQTTGLGEFMADDFVQMYPNPVCRLLTVNTRGSVGSAFRFTLTDMSGSVLKQTDVSGNAVSTVDLSGLSGGVYIAWLRSDSGLEYYRRIVVQH